MMSLRKMNMYWGGFSIRHLLYMLFGKCVCGHRPARHHFDPEMGWFGCELDMGLVDMHGESLPYDDEPKPNVTCPQ